MIKINETFDKIKNSCNYYIEFDSTNKKYKFNTMFVDDINYELFETSIEELKSEVIDTMSDLKEPQKYIKDLSKEINDSIDWYESKKVKDFKSFNEILFQLSTTTKNNPRIDSESKYSLELIQESPDELKDDYDAMYYHLIFNKFKTNNYKIKDDFEKVKLHFVVTKYFEAIYSLKNYFVLLDDIMTKYGIEDFNQFRPIPKPTLRCTVKLSKIETANLFNIFFESGYFYFDFKSEKKRDKAKMQFIDNNFNYINQHGKVANVNKIIKEFGEIKAFAHIEHQAKVIDELIDKLTEIKASNKIR